MPRTIVSGINLVVVAASVLYGAVLNAQQTDKAPPAAPVPVEIINAKKVFISNAGVDGLALAAFERLGEPHQPYNQFYTAMKSWGRYELVSAPAEAELVFEIRFGAPLAGSDKMSTYAPQYGVTILDTKTHFTLWTLAEPVEGAFRKTTFLKNFGQAVDRFMNDLKALPESLGSAFQRLTTRRRRLNDTAKTCAGETRKQHLPPG